MANAIKIAESMASEYARQRGISKSAGSYNALVKDMLPTATGIAEGISPFEKAVKKLLKAQRQRISALQERGIPDPRELTTFTDYTPNDTMIKQQSERLIKRSMNGHYPKPEIPDSLPPDWS